MNECIVKFCRGSNHGGLLPLRTNRGLQKERVNHTSPGTRLVSLSLIISLVHYCDARVIVHHLLSRRFYGEESSAAAED